MNYPDTNLLDASMPSDSSQSSAESDMELFVDAIEATADEMDYKDDNTIEDDSGRTSTSSPPPSYNTFQLLQYSHLRIAQLVIIRGQWEHSKFVASLKMT